MDDDQREVEQRAKVEDLQGSDARRRATWRLSPLVPRDLGWLFAYAQPIGCVLIHGGSNLQALMRAVVDDVR